MRSIWSFAVNRSVKQNFWSALCTQGSLSTRFAMKNKCHNIILQYGASNSNFKVKGRFFENVGIICWPSSLKWYQIFLQISRNFIYAKFSTIFQSVSKLSLKFTLRFYKSFLKVPCKFSKFLETSPEMLWKFNQKFSGVILKAFAWNFSKFSPYSRLQMIREMFARCEKHARREKLVRKKGSTR